MTKRPYVAREIDPATMTLMKNIKIIFDSQDILNAVKLFP